MRATSSMAIAALLVVAANAYATGERLLFDNPDYDIFVAEDYFCDQPVRVTVHSGQPGLFEADSPELQRIVDATQAVLAFECPNVRGIELEGRLAGLDEPVYFGVAGPRSDWVLNTKRSIRSEEYGQYQPRADDGGQGAPGAARGFTVANLSAGMPVDEARAAVVDTFGVEPAYDVAEGILTMQAGGCPADYDWAALSPSPEPGWKCLQAWFTDQRLARLYLLDLVQVIDSEDPQAVERHLIERFGEPVHRSTRERDSAWWQDTRTIHTLGWGEVVEAADAGDAEATDVYTLQAQVLPVGAATVVTVTLYEPELRAAASGTDADAPDLTL